MIIASSSAAPEGCTPDPKGETWFLILSNEKLVNFIILRDETLTFLMKIMMQNVVLWKHVCFVDK